MYVSRVSVRPLCYPINRYKRSKNPQIISGATLTRHNIQVYLINTFYHAAESFILIGHSAFSLVMAYSSWKQMLPLFKKRLKLIKKGKSFEFLGIIHCTVFFKHVSETGFCHTLHVTAYSVGPNLKIGTSCIDWVKMSRLLRKDRETGSSLWNIVL
jgi:hypothetical protein